MIIINTTMYEPLEVTNVFTMDYISLLLKENEFISFYLITSRATIILNKNQITSITDFKYKEAIKTEILTRVKP